MSAWTLASRPVSRFLTLSALPNVISAIVASSPLCALPSQTPGVSGRFAGDEAASTMTAQALGEVSTMHHKKLPGNAPSPCASGKRYKACCWDKRFEWDEDEAGTVFRSLPTGRWA